MCGYWRGFNSISCLSNSLNLWFPPGGQLKELLFSNRLKKTTKTQKLSWQQSVQNQDQHREAQKGTRKPDMTCKMPTALLISGVTDERLIIDGGWWTEVGAAVTEKQGAGKDGRGRLTVRSRNWLKAQMSDRTKIQEAELKHKYLKIQKIKPKIRRHKRDHKK